MNLNKIWNDVINFFKSNIWNIIFFFAILIIGIILIKIFMNILKRIMGKTHMDKIAQKFLIGALKLFLYLVLLLILLSKIGIEITGFLTALSAVVLAVGMALQNIIANAANGIVIVSTHIFKEGDYVVVDGVEGSITNINFLFTTLTTTDNKRVTLPNSIIVNNHVVNLGANPLRRVDFTFSVAYESDVEQVKTIIKNVMKSNGKVYLTPEPFCRLKVLNSSSIDFFANCWCDNGDYWDVYYYVIENVYNEFKRNNISIPYNQIEIRERTDVVNMPVIETALPERVEKVREKKKESFDLENADFSKLFRLTNKNDKKKKSNKK